MWKTKILGILTAAAMAGSAVQPVAAQGYNDRGYNNGQYNNGPYNNGNGYNGQYNGNQPTNERDRYQQDRNNYERDRQRYEADRQATGRFDRDAYYRECERQRSGNTAGGAIIGAIAGGLLGNTVSRGPQRGAGTAVGAILGGVVGASIGKNLDCENRSYAVNASYSGFEAGVPNRRYDWRGPRGDAYGYIQVQDYYQDRGARCAHYTQEIWVGGRPETARGYACRQPDGTWRMVG